jgi:exopolysaccharide biosynthesis polyprenyl glycosylphosphotransferase
MQQKMQNLVMTCLKTLDLILIWLSFGLAAFLCHNILEASSFNDFLSIRIKIKNFIIIILITIGWHCVLNACSLYKSKRLINIQSEILEVLKSSFFVSSALLIFAWMFKIEMVTMNFMISFFLFSSLIMIILRIIKRLCLNYLRKRGFNTKNIVIVGSNSRALKFAEKISSAPELGFKILGFVDDYWVGREEMIRRGYNNIANYATFSSYIRTNIVDEVVVSLPVKSFYALSYDIIQTCEKQGILVRLLSDIFTSGSSKTVPDYFEGECYLVKCAGAMIGWKVYVKRLVDIIASGLLLVVSSPLIIIGGFLVSITSKGGVFFLQDRIGLNKRVFTLYKLRTMYEGSEDKIGELIDNNEMNGPVFKIKGDPRITAVGKILRRLSIDELPQLFNVFKGDMSLVGPRPLPIRDYKGFNADWHRRRFSVKPGITCLWQISGRNSLTFDKWMELDIKYIDNWSLWLDFKICLRTIPAVLVGQGAM